MHHTPTSSTQSVAVLLVMSMTIILSYTFANAQAPNPLPTIITAASTLSSNRAVLPAAMGGCRLNVAAMTAAAQGLGQPAAQFQINGLAFGTTLLIDASAGSTWTNGPGLIVKIQNGVAPEASRITTGVINITGTLRKGSSVTIEGGGFIFTGAMIYLFPGFGLYEGSTLSISGTSMGALNGATTIFIVSSIVAALQDFTIADASTLSVSRNIFFTRNMTVGLGTSWCSVWVPFGSIFMSDGSKFSFFYNNYNISNVTAYDRWDWFVINTANHIQLTNSSLEFYSNTFTVTSVNMLSTTLVWNFAFCKAAYSVRLSAKSVLNMWNNSFEIKNSVMPRIDFQYVIALLEISVDTSSNLSITTTSTAFDNLKTSSVDTASVLVLRCGSTMVSSSSSVSISSNIHYWNRITGNYQLELVVSRSNFTVSNSSSFTISSNGLTVDSSSVASMAWKWVDVYEAFSLLEGSTMVVSRNTANITSGAFSAPPYPLSGYQVNLQKSARIFDSSSLFITNSEVSLKDNLGTILSLALIDFVFGEGMAVEAGSSLRSEGCTVRISGCDNVSGIVNISQIVIPQAEMKVESSSTLSILSHRIDISSSTFTNTLAVNAIVASNTLTVGNESSLTIQSCATSMYDDTRVMNSVELGGVLLHKSIAMPTSSSHVYIINNTVSLSTVSTTECTLELLRVVDAPTVYIQGRIRINSNHVVVSGMQASTGVYANLFSMKNSQVYLVTMEASDLTTPSDIQVSGNIMNVSTSTDLTGITFRVFKYFPKGTSTTSVSFNMLTLNASSIQSGFVVASVVSMFDTSSADVNWNTINCGSQIYITPNSPSSRVMALQATELQKSTASFLRLLHNSINGPNAYALYVSNTGGTNIVVETCRNYANGSLCVITNNRYYACHQQAGATTSIDFPDCTATTTATLTSFPTSSETPLMSNSQPHTSSSTVAPTPTRWSPTRPPKPTRTRTLSPLPTQTIKPPTTVTPPILPTTTLPSTSSSSSSSSTNGSVITTTAAAPNSSDTTATTTAAPPSSSTSHMSSSTTGDASSTTSSTTTIPTSSTAAPTTTTTASTANTSESTTTTPTASSTTPPPVKLCNITCHHTAVYVHATDMVLTSTADSLPLGAAVSAIALSFKGGAALPPMRGGVCGSTTSVPFSDTQDGTSTRRYILVHTEGGSSASLLNTTAELADLGVNKSDVNVRVSMTGVVTSPSSPSIAVLYGVEIRRTTDENALGSVSFGITLPPSSFGCTPDGAIPNSGYPGAIPFKLDSPPSALSENEKVAVAVMAMAVADLQTMAAIGLLRCSPGASEDDDQSEASIRALVPVALSGTCAGAVQGALVLIVGVLVISVALTLVLMRVKKVGWTEAATTSRCPGIVIVAWAFVQMGLVVCGGRLVSSSDGGEVGLGLVSMLLGLGLPVLCVFLAWGIVSRRCYRIAPKSENTFNDDPKSKRAPAVVRMVQRFLLPMYELDTKCIPICKAYSTVVGKTRRPSCVWAALPTIQPVIMAALAFSHGYVCSPLLVTTGVVMMLLAAVCYIVFRPHRIFTANFLQGFALILNSVVLMIAAKLVEAPLDITALQANRSISYIQMGLSVFRTVHALGAAGFMHVRGAKVYERVSADGTSFPPETAGVPTAPEHIAQPVFEYIAPCLGGAGVLPPSNSNAYDSESAVFVKHQPDLEQGLLPAQEVDIHLESVPSSSLSSSDADAELEEFLKEDEEQPVATNEPSSSSSDDEMHPPMGLPVGSHPTMDLLPRRGYVPMVRPYELIPEQMVVDGDDGTTATTTTEAWIKYTNKEDPDLTTARIGRAKPPSKRPATH